jgi:hypothetical protein
MFTLQPRRSSQIPCEFRAGSEDGWVGRIVYLNTEILMIC